MTTYIGTFGIGHLRSRCYQPILAQTAEEAARVMSERHGYEWSTIYLLEDYKQLQDRGLFQGHQPLPRIGSDVDNTDEVHQFFDKRYMDIMISPSTYRSKQERLQVLQHDICTAYKDKPAARPAELLQDIERQLC